MRQSRKPLQLMIVRVLCSVACCALADLGMRSTARADVTIDFSSEPTREEFRKVTRLLTTPLAHTYGPPHSVDAGEAMPVVLGAGVASVLVPEDVQAIAREKVKGGSDLGSAAQYLRLFAAFGALSVSYTKLVNSDLESFGVGLSTFGGRTIPLAARIAYHLTLGSEVFCAPGIHLEAVTKMPGQRLIEPFIGAGYLSTRSDFAPAAGSSISRWEYTHAFPYLFGGLRLGFGPDFGLSAEIRADLESQQMGLQGYIGF